MDRPMAPCPRQTSILRLPVILAGATLLSLCSSCSGSEEGSAPPRPLAPDEVEVALLPQLPEEDGGRRLLWSPYGKKLSLSEVSGGLGTELNLGPEGVSPIKIRLGKSPDAIYFDRLDLDLNRNGRFDEGETLETEPTETRNRFWSSFDAVVEIPVRDPVSGEEVLNSYPLSFWYVEDPAEPQEEPVLRFSRRGWMEGTAILNGVEARVLLTENEMDGIFDRRDSWALASADSAGDLLKAQYARDAGTHAWLFEKAYEIREIDPSGRRLVVAPFNPGITRAEEEEMHDELKVDREAPRSGRAMPFLSDYEEARNRALEQRMRLLVDFETTWCGPCKLMDEWVYTADPVVDAAAEVIAVKVDGDEHPGLKKQFSVEGFPTLVLLSPAGEEIRRVSGYVNVVDMVAFLSGK